MKGHSIVSREVERPAGGNVVDLMEALKRSIGTAREREVGTGWEETGVGLPP